MIRRLIRGIHTKPGSSVAEPHFGAARLNYEALKSWRDGDVEGAVRVQEQAVRIKENRGDNDLEQFREELASMQAGETPP